MKTILHLLFLIWFSFYCQVQYMNACINHALFYEQPDPTFYLNMRVTINIAGLPFLQDVEFLQWHFIALASALEIGTIVAVYLWRKRRRKADVIDENL